MSITSIVLGCAASYLIGSIPTGYIAGRVMKGVDLRKVGSGNLGTTNVFRSLGWGPAVAVFAVDMSKGLIPVLTFPGIFLSSEAGDPSLLLSYRIAFGTMAIMGHVWSFFLSFRGGKGVGTSFGVFLGLAPVATFFSLAVWVVLVVPIGIVSIGSLGAAVSFPFFLLLTEQGILEEKISLFLFGSLVTILVVYTHRSNIWRLLRGEEQSLKKKRGDDGVD